MNIVILSLIYHCLHSFNLHFNFFFIIIDENIEKAEIRKEGDLNQVLTILTHKVI